MLIGHAGETALGSLSAWSAPDSTAKNVEKAIDSGEPAFSAQWQCYRVFGVIATFFDAEVEI
jgi:hypothetical protein